MRLRWKKWRRETGLKSVSENPHLPSDYHDGKNVYATVKPLGGGWTRPLEGWFFYGCVGNSSINTAQTPCSSEKEAKKKAESWVKNNLDGES